MGLGSVDVPRNMIYLPVFLPYFVPFAAFSCPFPVRRCYSGEITWCKYDCANHLSLLQVDRKNIRRKRVVCSAHGCVSSIYEVSSFSWLLWSFTLATAVISDTWLQRTCVYVCRWAGRWLKVFAVGFNCQASTNLADSRWLAVNYIQLLGMRGSPSRFHCIVQNIPRKHWW